jgi:hypothetical protein
MTRIVSCAIIQLLILFSDQRLIISLRPVLMCAQLNRGRSLFHKASARASRDYSKNCLHSVRCVFGLRSGIHDSDAQAMPGGDMLHLVIVPSSLLL